MCSAYSETSTTSSKPHASHCLLLLLPTPPPPLPRSSRLSLRWHLLSHLPFLPFVFTADLHSPQLPLLDFLPSCSLLACPQPFLQPITRTHTFDSEQARNSMALFLTPLEGRHAVEIAPLLTWREACGGGSSSTSNATSLKPVQQWPVWRRSWMRASRGSSKHPRSSRSRCNSRLCRRPGSRRRWTSVLQPSARSPTRSHSTTHTQL